MNFNSVKKNQTIIIFLGLILFFSCPNVSAADDELSLENELNQAQGTTSSSPVPTSEEPTSEVDPGLESALNDPAVTGEVEEPVVSGGRSEVEYDKEELQVQSLEQQYAMKGFAMGFVAFNHNYNVDANMRVDGVLADISTKSPDFQSVGVGARYAILPFNKVGTDINIAIGSTINHANANFSSIMTVKAEVNLGYSIHFANVIPMYILAGIGHEITKGTDIETIVVPGGGTIQAGAGFGLGKKINFEIFYSVSNHAVSGVYLSSAVQAAKQGGATSAGFKNLTSRVSSNVVLGKLSINF